MKGGKGRGREERGERERRMAKEIGRKERKRAGGREGQGKSHIM